MITAAQGVGKKIAQRIILELKDKISKEAGELDLGTVVPAAVEVTPENPAKADAVAALTVLGYSMPEINKALQKISAEGMSTEQIVKAVLRTMMQ